MSEIDPDRVWIFGYGSLIFRPAFRFERRVPGLIRGFVRRLWQGSPDHRGTLEAPGRVATLVPEVGGACVGMAYLLAATEAAQVLTALDVREQGGYRRLDIAIEIGDSERVAGITYFADATNPHYLGNAAAEVIAATVRESVGPSGPNAEYVRRLEVALDEIGCADPHVIEIARLLR